MSAFARAELRARRRMLAGLALGALALLLIVALSYDSLGRHGLGTAFGSRPPRVLTAFSGSRGGDVLAPGGWMGFGFTHPLFLVLILTVAIAVGAGAVAGEVDSGRAELLFTGPVRRSRFVAGALAVWAAGELLVLVAGLAGAVAGAALTPSLRHAGLARLAWAPLQALPLSFLAVTAALLASTLAHTRGRAVGLALGATVFAYLLNVVSALLPGLDWLRWLTPFGYYDPGTAIRHGLDVVDAAVLVGAGLVLLLAARAALGRRDLA